MRKQYILAICLLLPVLLLAGWVMQIEYALRTEQTVMVRMRGFDPRDLLSGRYLLLQPDWEATDCTQFASGSCPMERFDWHYRYYLPEFDASQLDEALRRSDLRVDMIFAYRGQSKPLVKELLIEGKPWEIWLKQSATQPAVH